jgi:hypothetical protein
MKTTSPHFPAFRSGPTDVFRTSAKGKFLAIIMMATTVVSTQAALYTNDFSSGSVTNQVTGYIGGWFGSNFNFQQWYGGTGNADITAGSLTVSSDSGYRSAVILFEPAAFLEGAGRYRITVDVSSYTGDANDRGLVRVWSGAGYDLSGSTGNGISVSSEAGTFTAFGSATVADLGSLEITSTGNHVFEFTYDGIGAVGIFLGAETAGYPFPQMDYNSISVVAVPETSSAILGCFAWSVMLVRRRR